MVKKYSTQKLSDILKQLPSLCLSASGAEFSSRLEEWDRDTGIRPETFLGYSTDGSTPYIFSVLYGNDAESKFKYLLDRIGPQRFEILFFELEGPTGTTFASLLGDNARLRPLFESYGFIFTRQGGAGYKTSSFEWNGFQVLNAGFNPETMGDTLQELAPFIEKIKKTGFGKALYGPVVFVGAPMKGQVHSVIQQRYRDVEVGAYYDIERDNIVVKAEPWKESGLYPGRFLHELGHRVWYKVMSPTQRQRWQAHFESRGKKITKPEISAVSALIESCAGSIPGLFAKRDLVDLSEFDSASFTRKLKQNPTLKEVVDFIVLFWAEQSGAQSKQIGRLRTKWFRSCFETEIQAATLYKVLVQAWEKRDPSGRALALARHGRPDIEVVSRLEQEGVAPEKITPLAKIWDRIVAESYTIRNWYRNRWLSGLVDTYVKLPHSVSEYGTNNEQEDYAEAFEHFMTNREMPQDIYREFVSLHGIRLGTRKKAELSPREEIEINALQKRIDTLYRKKNYEEAEALEERLETLLNDVEAREEYFDTESDESEDFYGWKNRLTQRPNLVPDLDDEHSNPSLEEELAKLYHSWITDDGRFEDVDAFKDWINSHPGSTWKDVPEEIMQSKEIFVGIVSSLIGDTYPSHMDDAPRKDITFEEAFAAAKDAYEAVTARRNRTRERIKKLSEVSK